ncbi:MAG: AP2 domain-containing protein [Rhodothermales bacterium]
MNAPKPSEEESIHHITRIDIEPDEAHPTRSPTHGWLVRVRRQGVRTSKFFSDKKYGSREAALHQHAIPYRNTLLETLPEPDDPVRRSAEARSQSGVVGLHFLHKDIGNGTRKPYIQLSWIDQSGKRHSASYSVEKWGLRRAVWNGCLRLYKERPDGRDPYEMFRIAYPNILKQYGPQPEYEPEPLSPEEMQAELDPNDQAQKLERRMQIETDWQRISSAPTTPY